MILGIDIGSTTTKAVSMDGGRIIHKVKTKAADAITSAAGAIGKLSIENNIGINCIEKLVITGVGADRLEGDILSIPTGRSSEILAIGRGGLFLAGKDGILISNIGTGTAFVEAAGDYITHLGGTGVGGGTIIGLSKALLNTTDFGNIMDLAGRGDITKVDLQISDIVSSKISFLNGDATAANFGKMLDTSNPEDIAAGIINMTYQVIGMLCVFAAKGKNYSSVVVTGNGSRNILGQRILEQVGSMYGIVFEYPEEAEYATAIGAALQ